MQFRRWLPFRDIQTRHLRLLLATARVFAWIGMLMIAAGIAYGIAVGIQSMGGGPGSALAVMAVGTVIGLIGWGLVALAVGGALAALVGIEESQRRQVERD